MKISSRRRRVRLKCHLHFAVGRSYSGYSRDISGEGLFVVCHGVVPGAVGTPKIGDTGVLSVELGADAQGRVVKSRFRVVRSQPDGFELHCNFSELGREDCNALSAIMV